MVDLFLPFPGVRPTLAVGCNPWSQSDCDCRFVILPSLWCQIWPWRGLDYDLMVISSNAVRNRNPKWITDAPAWPSKFNLDYDHGFFHRIRKEKGKRDPWFMSNTKHMFGFVIDIYQRHNQYRFRVNSSHHLHVCWNSIIHIYISESRSQITAAAQRRWTAWAMECNSNRIAMTDYNQPQGWV